MAFQNITSSGAGDETLMMKFARAVAGSRDPNSTTDPDARPTKAIVPPAYGTPVRVNPNTRSRIPRPSGADDQPSPPPLDLPGVKPNPVPGTLTAGVNSQPKPISLGAALANQDAPQMDPRMAQARAALARDSVVTPKTDPRYKMGIGARLLGSLANFAGGMAGSGREPIYVGPGATNRAYDQAEQERKHRTIADQAQIDSYQNQYNDAVAQRRNQIQDSMATPASGNAANQPIVNPVTQQNLQPGRPKPAQKIVGKGRVMALARKHKVPYPHAKKQFEDKNYVVK